VKFLRKKVPAALVLSSAGAVAFSAGCSPAPEPMDGGVDAGKTDAGKTDAGTDAGYDAGTDAGTDAGCTATMPCTERINACGMKCGCIGQYNPNTMMIDMVPYCDPDIGNPCALGCFNPKKPDGGREYQDEDAGIYQCLC
jgi:hypothetical protein